MEPVQLHRHTVIGICCPVDEDNISEQPENTDIPKQTTSQVFVQETTLNKQVPPVPDHLIDLFERSKIGLNEQQQCRLAVLLVNYADVFVTKDGQLGRTNVVKHTINTGDCAPIKQMPRRLPIHMREVMDDEIDKMLENNVIEPSNSPWSSPIVLVKKKDGSVRLCVDYRKINAVTVKDSFPIPNINASIDTLVGSRWFSTLDLSSGFWQVKMDKADQAKTAFVTQRGLYQFKVMSFGPCNATATFQRLMETVMNGLTWNCILLYVDD